MKRLIQFILRWVYRLTIVFLLCILFSLLWVLILRWTPIYFTPYMLYEKYRLVNSKSAENLSYHWVKLENISDDMKIAVVASEDQNFPTHSGFDWAAIELAREENKKGKTIRGASTISQQVAKNVFLWQGRSYLRKGLEAYFTVLIEYMWGKRRILEVYLNIAEMGKGVFGVEAASRQYFKKNAQNLNIYESSLLAAVLPNPKIYLAAQPNGFVIWRRNLIIYQIQMLGGSDYLKNSKILP